MDDWLAEFEQRQAERTDRIQSDYEKYVGWGQEDDDLGRRLYLAGIKPQLLINSARVTHLWHPRDNSAPPKWNEGKNVPYYQRRRINAYCENSLIKPGPEKTDDIIITKYNFD